MDGQRRERVRGGYPGHESRAGSLGGYSVLEMSVVAAIAGVMLSLAAWGFADYSARSGAQRAALVFAQDLKLARSAAVRGQEPVVIRFDEEAGWYQIVTGEPETELARRRFFEDADVSLQGIDLLFEGDSVVFSTRGVAELGGSPESYGEARFLSGSARFRVRFNGTGTARVDELDEVY